MSYTRKQRGTTQSIFLIETVKSQKEYEREYVVMGSTGNIYHVLITNNPTCTCPDFITRGNRCKHIYFVLLRIMKVDPDNEDQEEYDEEELLEMFSNIPDITNNLIVDETKKKTYHKLVKNKNKLEKKEVIQKETDDLCPICLDDLENGDDLDYCKYSCGKPVHKVCYGMWVKAKANQTCIYCRANWTGVEKETKYINLNETC